MLEDKAGRLLVVDDDPEIAQLLKTVLEAEGYCADVRHDGQSALESVHETEYALAILDVMLPGMDGCELCRRLREQFFFPILMVTARGSDMDKITGLMMGADDYIVKPFNPMEVVMRVKAQLRRAQVYAERGSAPARADEIRISGLCVCGDSRSCTLDGAPLELTPTEFDILLYLCKNRGRVVASEELFEKVWGEKYLENNNTVAAHITRLREKMCEIPRKPRYIKTAWGVGYKIE